MNEVEGGGFAWLYRSDLKGLSDESVFALAHSTNSSLRGQQENLVAQFD